MDVFALAGIDKPNIGLLSDAFLEDVRNMLIKNLAVELLEKLLRNDIKAHTRTNVVLQKKFSDRLLERCSDSCGPCLISAPRSLPGRRWSGFWPEGMLT